MVTQTSAGIFGPSPSFLPRAAMGDLVRELQALGYTVVAPTKQDTVLMMRPIRDASEIAQGFKDRQDAGHYRLERGDEPLYFEHVVGPNGARSYFFPTELPLYRIRMTRDAFESEELHPPPPSLAFIGLRPCDLAAIAVGDRVFDASTGPSAPGEPESYYRKTRHRAFIVAVNCTRPGGTCFCTSMGTGPQALEGFDLAFTELKAGFVVECGSERGVELVSRLPVRAPSDAELELAEIKLDNARNSMGRTLDPAQARLFLAQNPDHPQFDDVAARCLSCGNCTMVCPTCFCNTVVDASSLTDGSVTRTRYWESCFTHQFSYAGGSPHRASIRGRYRHWLRHKLLTWWEQFGTSGCVGCGRCITWCPASIDLTREAQPPEPHSGESPHARGGGGTGVSTGNPHGFETGKGR